MGLIGAQRTLSRLVALAVFGILATYLLLRGLPFQGDWKSWGYVRSSYDWEKRIFEYPFAPSDMIHPPSGTPHKLRRIQHDFSHEPKDKAHDKLQDERREAVLNTAKKCWESYREFAWGHDELKPSSLVGADPFGGWGATLVDSLDTLWIMGLKTEFKEAVKAVGLIDWDKTTATSCSVFETNIRYLGGLLSAYELSGEKTLLRKALEVGHMLFAAFDTPNHMPLGTFYFDEAKAGGMTAGKRVSLATVGTLSLEFTRLSQLTGDPRFYTAIDGIKQQLIRTQNTTKIPGLWPTYIDLRNGFLVEHDSFTLGASADSGYEYLPKMYALVGGLDDSYAEMHKVAMETAREYLVFRAMLPRTPGPSATSPGPYPDVLFSGTVLSKGQDINLHPAIQHLGCFAGGHFALGGKLFGLDNHVEVGEQIARGCAWAYGAFPAGVMPEGSELIACAGPDSAPCEWNETRWDKEGGKNIPKGFQKVRDPHYLLRPEAVESIFILYRITGKKDLLDLAWTMFESIKKATETPFAHSAVASVLAGGPDIRTTDSMEVRHPLQRLLGVGC